MKKNALSFPGPNRSLRSRVPRPTICQNLVFERTSLRNTRLTTSGMSMPVSSMSTSCAWPRPRPGVFRRPPQHVVHEALALLVGHAADFELAITRLVERPAGFLEQEADEVVAGRGLLVVLRVRPGA